jgi:Na+-driven multidrug efflux pump
MLIPTVASLTIRQMSTVITYQFVGNSPLLVSALGIGNAYENIFGVSLILGYNSLLDTLISQAAGQNNYKLCGLYLNKGRLTVILLMIPIIILKLLSGSLLTMIGVDQKVAELA